MLSSAGLQPRLQQGRRGDPASGLSSDLDVDETHKQDRKMSLSLIYLSG